MQRRCGDGGRRLAMGVPMPYARGRQAGQKSHCDRQVTRQDLRGSPRRADEQTFEDAGRSRPQSLPFSERCAAAGEASFRIRGVAPSTENARTGRERVRPSRAFLARELYAFNVARDTGGWIRDAGAGY